MMNEKDNLKINNQQPVIEDLTIRQDRAVEVKGGPTQGRGRFCLSTDINEPLIRP
jgi:hypothetical protein